MVPRGIIPVLLQADLWTHTFPHSMQSPSCVLDRIQGWEVCRPGVTGCNNRAVKQVF